MTNRLIIDRFTGGYGFLSNFHTSPVAYEGRQYRSVEHAYQAAKSLRGAVRDRIANLKIAGEAKREGRRVQLRPGWEGMKLQVMLDLLRLKFRESDLREAILATGDAELVEGNDWGDNFWGVCMDRGKNHLGKLLMQVRDELKVKSRTREGGP